MAKFFKVGVWLVLPVLAAAWLAVVFGALSVMGTLQNVGHLVDAASITTLSGLFAVLVLAVVAAVLDAKGRQRLATAARVAAFVLAAGALIVAAGLMRIVLGG